MDNLELMKQMDDESVDLIYCDILYNTGRKFKDFDDVLGTTKEAIEWYRPRLIEMKRILKNTGSVYLHCDTRLSHYLKVEMDYIFGEDRFKSDIIACIKSGNKSKKYYAGRYDNILYYTKGSTWIYNMENIGRENPEKARFKHRDDVGWYRWNREHLKDYKRYLKTVNENDVWTDVGQVQGNSKENTGYSTQKPILLLERIIKASSNEGDIVADFFCGSGTTGVAAKELGRNYILCDIGERAVEISGKRLNEI